MRDGLRLLHNTVSVDFKSLHLKKKIKNEAMLLQVPLGNVTNSKSLSNRSSLMKSQNAAQL